MYTTRGCCQSLQQEQTPDLNYFFAVSLKISPIKKTQGLKLLQLSASSSKAAVKGDNVTSQLSAITFVRNGEKTVAE